MQITLNPNLKKATRKIHLPIANLASILERKLDKSKSYKLVASTISRRVETLQEGFLSSISRAYSDHEKLQLAPHDIWYLVLSEIAIVIRENTEICRALFTRSEEKIDISVPVSDITEIDLDAIVARLADLIPVNTSIFLPDLSTHTAQSRIAMCAALCDGVQAYYSYSTYCCGIPEVRITGTHADWTTLLSSSISVGDMFASVGLDAGVKYMQRVSALLKKISDTFVEPDVAFWRDIFRSKNVGSGGELLINGWIKDFYFDQREDSTLQNYMTSVTIVPFYSLSAKKHFKSVFGAFERHRTADDFIYSDYASLTFEVLEKDESNKDKTVSKMVDRILANPVEIHVGE